MATQVQEEMEATEGRQNGGPKEIQGMFVIKDMLNVLSRRMMHLVTCRRNSVPSLDQLCILALV